MLLDFDMDTKKLYIEMYYLFNLYSEESIGKLCYTLHPVPNTMLVLWCKRTKYQLMVFLLLDYKLQI